MNKTQIVQAVIAGVALAVTLAVLRWLFGILDAIVPISSASEKVRALFKRKRNRELLVNAAVLLFVLLQLVLFVRDPSPVSRISIVYILSIGMLMPLLLIVRMVQLFRDIIELFKKTGLLQKADATETDT